MTVAEAEANVIKFSVADKEIAELKSKFSGLNADTPSGYDDVRRAIATTRKYRVEIEAKRKELKADALEYGRRVDSEAKRLTAAIIAIEEPLQASKDRIDKEAERVRQEKEEAKRKEYEELARKQREAEELRLKVIRDAEELRLSEERKALEAERAAIEAERARVAAEQKAKADAEEAALRVQRAAIEAEKAKIAEEQRIIAEKNREIERQKQEAERVEFERLATIKAEKEAKEKAEREALEKERIRKEEEQRRADEEKAAAALAPDIDKLRAFADTLRLIDLPEMNTTKAKQFFNSIIEELRQLAIRCETFKK